MFNKNSVACHRKPQNMGVFESKRILVTIGSHQVAFIDIDFLWRPYHYTTPSLRPYFVDVIYAWPRGENHFFMQLTVQTDFEEISKNKIIREKSVWNNRNSSTLF